MASDPSSHGGEPSFIVVKRMVAQAQVHGEVPRGSVSPSLITPKEEKEFWIR
jgi:hypothetical protein